MSHKTRIILSLIAVVAVIGFVSWIVWPRPLSPKNTSTVQEQTRFLSDSEYQQKVTTVLTDLASASASSWKQQLSTSLASLQTLRVSSQVKYDHLLLFTALDIWQADDLTPAIKANVKTKLQTFAQRQPWSQSAIDSLLTKTDLAS